MVSPAQQHNGHATLRFWVQQCPRLCTVVSSATWMAVRGGGRRCMGFGGAKQQVPSPWGEKQFKPIPGFESAQENTGEHRRTQEHTGEHSSAQENTGAQRRTRECRGEHRSAQENTAAHRRTQERTGEHRSAQENTGAHRTTQERTGQHSRVHHSQGNVQRWCTGMTSFPARFLSKGPSPFTRGKKRQQCATKRSRKSFVLSFSHILKKRTKKHADKQSAGHRPKPFRFISALCQ